MSSQHPDINGRDIHVVTSTGRTIRLPARTGADIATRPTPRERDALRRLRDRGLVEHVGGEWRLTAKGRTYGEPLEQQSRPDHVVLRRGHIPSQCDTKEES